MFLHEAVTESQITDVVALDCDTWFCLHVWKKKIPALKIGMCNVGRCFSSRKLLTDL